MQEYIHTLEQEFKLHANAEIASGQKAYMRNQFEFFGIKFTERRELSKPFYDKKHLPPKTELEAIVKMLWKKPERDFQFFAQELVFIYRKRFEKKDIALLEYMVTNKSWWDTVDYIATKLMGEYFKLYPDEKEKYVAKWIDSNNIWLQRSALLFQLKYKKDMDTALLSKSINALTGTKEFFINKAIGWVLREYSRTNSKWVLNFIANTELSTLSRKEALRLITK